MQPNARISSAPRLRVPFCKGTVAPDLPPAFQSDAQDSILHSLMPAWWSHFGFWSVIGQYTTWHIWNECKGYSQIKALSATGCSMKKTSGYAIGRVISLLRSCSSLATGLFIFCDKRKEFESLEKPLKSWSKYKLKHLLHCFSYLSNKTCCHHILIVQTYVAIRTISYHLSHLINTSCYFSHSLYLKQFITTNQCNLMEFNTRA